MGGGGGCIECIVKSEPCSESSLNRKISFLFCVGVVLIVS